MGIFQSPYNRLQEYYSLLTNGQADMDLEETFSEFGLSITEISNITKIPLPVIRNDFKTIFEFQFSLNIKAQKININGTMHEITQDNIFVFSEDSSPTDDNNDPFCIYKVLNRFNEPQYQKYFFQYLSIGSLDDIPIALSTRRTENYLVYLNSAEAQALTTQAYADSSKPLYELFSETYEKTYQIKDSIRYVKNTPQTNHWLEIINEAITEHQTLEMIYKPTSMPAQNFVFIPIKLAYDANDNIYYVLSINQNSIFAYRLDRIINCFFSKNKQPYPDSLMIKRLDEISPQVWGCSFSDAPIQVKVKFKNVANVWKKVRSELSYRTKGTLYENDEWLYYEDTVYGIYKFRSWIYSFGRAAVVLEPQDLRVQIIESLKERLM